VSTKQIEDYISTEAGVDFSKVFDQYLRDVRIPTLEYYSQDGNLVFRWANAVADFDMPVKVIIDSREQWLKPTTNWNSMAVSKADINLTIDPNFYVAGFDITKEN
jgi:hypothetical protein